MVTIKFFHDRLSTYFLSKRKKKQFFLFEFLLTFLKGRIIIQLIFFFEIFQYLSKKKHNNTLSSDTGGHGPMLVGKNTFRAII